jgi:hypothetical protein
LLRPCVPVGTKRTSKNIQTIILLDKY